jgi:proline dehydrogenase
MGIPKRVALALWKPIERRAAGAYLAGPTLSDALEAGDRIAPLGYGVVLGFWNAEHDPPATVAGEHLRALGAIAPRGRGWYLSIKAPALDFSSDLVRGAVEAAAPQGTVVHFDSHAIDTADRTIALALETRAMHDEVGITLPGRWRRSLADADRAADAGLRVRVVKGEWSDPDDSDRDMRAGFLEIVDRLAGRPGHVSVATHDAELAREAVARLATGGAPHDIELLTGLPFDRVVEVARSAGLPVRVYVPYGHASLRYGLQFLRRNPRRTWWLIRDLALRRRRSTPPALGHANGPRAWLVPPGGAAR